MRLGRASVVSIAVVAAGAVAVLPGCGGGKKGAGAGKGGSVTFAQESQPDFLDPGVSYTVDGWEPMWNVYTPLVTFAHKPGVEGAKLVPALAENLPEVSADGKAYTAKLRSGLKYSDGTPVRASDFKWTIERLFKMDSGGVGFYSDIVGAEEFGKTKKGGIGGIETNDKTGEITVKLTKPRATFLYELGLPFASLVPKGTPAKDQTKTPIPATGPFAITKSVPNRQYVLERNPNFQSSDDLAEAKLDKITVNIVPSLSRATNDVINNKVDYISAATPPPADRLPEVKSKYADRFRVFTTNSTYYFFLNTREKPFDNLKARQAVNYALDKNALVRLFGGLFAPDCTVLPPGMVGYKKYCLYDSDGDPATPDLNKARQLVQESGTKGEAVTVWGDDEDPTKKITEYYADVLNSIGYKAKPKVLDASVYFQTIGNQKTKAQTGFTDWFQDYPHPANFIDTLLNGTRITETLNNNTSNADDPEINKEIDALSKVSDLQSVADRWAALDRKVMEKAYWAPYGHRQLAAFFSNRVDADNCFYARPIYYTDYAGLCLKKGVK